MVESMVKFAKNSIEKKVRQEETGRNRS